MTELAGLLALLASTLAPAWAAGLIVRRFHPGLPAAARWVATGLVSVALLVTLFLATALPGVFRPIPVCAASLAVGAAAHWRWGHHAALREEVRAGAAWLRWLTASRPRLAVALASAGYALVAAARALAMPPLAWDSLTYHLVLAGQWVRRGAFLHFWAPDGMDGYSHFPFNGEALAAWLMLPFHGDLVVNLLGFPILALGGVAIYALARELGARRDVAGLAALAVSFSPMNFAYVTTAYVDVQAYALVAVATLFFVRYLREPTAAEAVLTFVALGCSLGTKLSTVTYAAPFVLVVALIALRLAIRERRAARLLPPVLGLLLMLPLGAPQYLYNWLAAGNPVYPMAVRLSGHEVFPGSLYQARAVEQIGLGDPARDLANLEALVGYEPWDYPRSAGPKYLLLCLAALSLLVVPLSRLPWKRAWLLSGLWAFPLVAFYLGADPLAVVVRRFWLNDTPRFLASPLALAAVLGAVQLGRLETRWLPALAIVPFLVADLAHVNTTFFVPGVGLTVAASLAALLGAAWLAWRRLPRKTPWIAAGLIPVLLAGLGLAELRRFRDATRWSQYARYVDLHPTPVEGFAAGWRFCDRPGRPVTIALTTGWAFSGHNWFFYPLLGSRLQNEVVYAQIQHPGDPPTHLDRGLLREHGDPEIWLANLRRLGVDLVFVQWPPPIEVQWMRDRPELFHLVDVARFYAVFRFEGTATSPKTSPPA